LLFTALFLFVFFFGDEVVGRSFCSFRSFEELFVDGVPGGVEPVFVDVEDEFVLGVLAGLEAPAVVLGAIFLDDFAQKGFPEFAFIALDDAHPAGPRRLA